MNLITELRRRNVIRMAGLYLVGAWLITQVAATVLPLFGAPDWVARSVIVVLAIGFVVSFVSGIVVIRYMLDFVQKRGLAPFGWWRIVVGAAGLIALALR